MKKLSLVILSLASISFANANDSVIFGAEVTLNKSCQVSVRHNKKESTFTPKFSNTDNCSLVTHDGTNIIHTKFINGAYIFFIENNHTSEGKCFSEYTAFGLSKDLSLHTTAMVKSSLSCYRGKEMQAFEYFSAKLNQGA